MAGPAACRSASSKRQTRRDRLIEAETKRLKSGAAGPVIAAGSTGSMPSTAMLLETIAGLPQGAVVLPGLDTDLDEPSWRMILADSDGHEAVNIRNSASRRCCAGSALRAAR